MRLEIYNFLVNKHPGIKKRYHAMHDDSTGLIRVLSHFYLLWLNFAYYILFMHHLGVDKKTDVYELKNLEIKRTELEKFRAEHPGIDVEHFVKELSKHEVISFDIFDTLIFRPFSEPGDVFFLLGEKLELLDFKGMRMRAEWEARLIRSEAIREKIKKEKKRGVKSNLKVDFEVSLDDIWNRMEVITCLDANAGKTLEEETEMEICYANPFMKTVYDRLIAMGKRIIITSDMYLSEEFLKKLLEKNGYSGYERIFISNKYHKSKSDGRLFDVVRKELGEDTDIIHCGDNLHSDIKMASEHGLATLHYPNVNANALLFRPFDMSPIIGGAYRGIVNNKIYGSDSDFRPTMEYEYGYVYGGLFVTGYCAYIHNYAKLHGMDKLLFLSRDGDIIKQVYDKMYPSEADCTEYAYWSRKAATILTFDLDRNDYYRRFLYHKVNQEYKISEILASMELEDLGSTIDGFTLANRRVDLIGEEGRKVVLHLEDELTDKNVHVLRVCLDGLAERIRAVYHNRDAAAKAYYKKMLQGCDKALAIDIGWAGSGAIAIRRLCREKWGIPCDVFGMIAGTNTVHNAEPYQTETFLQSGVMNAYLYSQSHNRDLLKKHDPAKDYNIFWELLLGSPTKSFRGFKLNPDGSIGYDFGSYDDNLDGIRDVQAGIRDFADDYMKAFGSPEHGYFQEMYRISGRDAYAPIIVASSHKEKYLKAVESKFELEPNVV